MKRGKQPMVLFLTSGGSPKVMEAGASRSEEDWTRLASGRANAVLRAVEVRFSDGRRITVKPDFASERVRAAAARLANRNHRDVEVYVEGDFRYRVSPTTAADRSGVSIPAGGPRVPS